MGTDSSKCADFKSSSRTLKTEEIDPAHQKVLEALTKGLGVKIRQENPMRFGKDYRLDYRLAKDGVLRFSIISESNLTEATRKNQNPSPLTSTPPQ